MMSFPMLSHGCCLMTERRWEHTLRPTSRQAVLPCRFSSRPALFQLPRNANRNEKGKAAILYSAPASISSADLRSSCAFFSRNSLAPRIIFFETLPYYISFSSAN